MNDGSRGRSLKIMKAFLQKTDIICIIDKGNTRYGLCINEGSQMSNGKYLSALR